MRQSLTSGPRQAPPLPPPPGRLTGSSRPRRARGPALGGRQPGVWLSATARGWPGVQPAPTARGWGADPERKSGVLGRTCPHNEHELAPDLVRRIRTAVGPPPRERV